MGFVKTSVEMERLRAVQRDIKFYSEHFWVEVEVDASFVAAVVPAPLQVDGTRVRVAVNRSQSTTVSETLGAVVYVPARYEDLVGSYMLAIYYVPEAAVAWGRHLVGEPKKMADIELFRFGRQRRARVRRHDEQIIEMHASLTEEASPVPVTGNLFNVRATLSMTGHALQFDPELTVTTVDIATLWERRGTGGITMRSTPHDPLGDIPVVNVVCAGAREAISRERSRRLLTTIDREYFLPFYYGTHLDDWSALSAESDELRAIAAAAQWPDSDTTTERTGNGVSSCET